MIRKKIFLHIGWEKTGTSALQVFLNSNEDWLAAHGYLYPSMAMAPQHLELFQALSGTSSRKRHQMIGRVRDMISLSQADCLLFSHERLHICEPALFQEMFEGHDVEVIAYIRRYDEAIISLLATFVRWGMLSVHPRATLPLRFARQYLSGIDYVWPLKGFATSFGHQNVHVRVYNSRQFSARSMIPDFLKLVGLTDQKDALWPELRANLSPSAAEMVFLLAAGEAINGISEFYAPRQIREVASALLNADTRRSSVSVLDSIPLATKQRIISSFSDSSELLSREFFDGRPVFEPPQKAKVEFPGLTPDDINAFTAIIGAEPGIPDAVKLKLSQTSW